LALPSVYGQSVPQGMKYQAVARDLAGEVILTNQFQSNLRFKAMISQNGSLYRST
jgi:hypothetical protein